MKKLMTVMASAATALFAIGAVNGDDQPLNATSFEQLTPNTQLNTLADDAGITESGVKYWYMASSDADNGTLVTNDVAGGSVSRPDYFAQASNTNSLALDTSSPLFRHMGSSDGTIPSAGTAIGDGIYLDTLVKFTAADDVFGTDALATGDKIAISYVEQGDDVANPITNFVIRAGYIGGEGITATNYIATLPAGVEFNKDAWHRLTVRTLPGIDTAGNLGFVVYVDTNALVRADANQTIGDNVTLAGAALSLDKSVFPSAVAFNNGTDGSTITAASFSGTGAIDDVVFTKVMPGFIATSSAVPVSITLGTGVTGVTVTVGQETINPVDATVTPLVFNLPAGTTSFSLTGTLDTGYENIAAVFADEDETSTFENGTVSFEGASLAFTVKASRNNFNLFDAQGQAISGMFETLSQALAVTGVAKIQLAYDYVVPADEIPENAPVFEIAGEVVLDLNGKTLNGGGSDSDEMFYVEGVLRVVDSSSANTGKIIYTGEAGVFAADSNAELYIGAAVGDYGPKIDGVLFVKKSEGLVVNAKVLASANTAEDAFVWADFVAEGSALKAAQVDGYWVVKPNGGDEPEGYDNGGDGTFVIAAATETALKANLPAGKTLADKVSASSDLTYAQAYALGLWDAEAEEVAELEATISVGADGKVTVTLANEPADGYLVTCKVYEKASLTADWPEEAKATYAYGSEQAFTPGSATAGFYKVEVVITNSVQQ